MKFRSKFEEDVCKAAKRSRKKFEYEPFYIPYTMYGNYLPDVVLPNGIVVEIKGYLDPSACKKMKAVKKSNPTLDIRFVFMYPNKRVGRLKCKHWEWAERHGFKWADRTIPLSWWKEKPVVT